MLRTLHPTRWQLARALPAILACGFVHTVSAQDWDWEELSIPMRDTNTLAADVWSSETNRPAKPVILIQTPYNKNFYRIGAIPASGGPNFPHTTNYHFVIVDWRGFFGSLSATKPLYNRGLDGYDCVQWIATQTWCNGRVGTWGSSALGYIQYQTAAQHPSNLASCVIQVKDFQTRYDNFYYGGDYRKEHVESVAALGLTSTNLILDHPTFDLYWQLTESLTDNPDTVAVPLLVVGGWFDHFPDTVLRSYRDLRESSDPAVRNLHRMIFGPWLHGLTGKEDQGVLTYANATNLDADTIDYWDYTLRGQTNQWATNPAVSFYQMGEDIWIMSANWTGITRNATSLYLRADGGLYEQPAPTNDPALEYAYDPADPTPVLGGSRFDPFSPLLPIGPQDLAPTIESRADVLAFSTPLLERPLRINGPVTVVLYASSDRTDTDFAVRLTDVYPDGRSLIMTQGIRRGRFRNSYSTQTLLTPGQVYPIEIDLQELGLTIQPGHRLRIDVSSACYPHFDLNRNDGGPMYTNGPMFVATNRLFFGPSQPSRVAFTILPDDMDGDGMNDFWEAVHFRGLERNGAGDYDSDGVSDLDEWRGGTVPTNAASLLRIAKLTPATNGVLELTWPSASGHTYTVVTAQPTNVAWSVYTNVAATPATNQLNLPTDAASLLIGVRTQPP